MGDCNTLVMKRSPAFFIRQEIGDGVVRLFLDVLLDMSGNRKNIMQEKMNRRRIITIEDFGDMTARR